MDNQGQPRNCLYPNPKRTPRIEPLATQWHPKEAHSPVGFGVIDMPNKKYCPPALTDAIGKAPAKRKTAITAP